MTPDPSTSRANDYLRHMILAAETAIEFTDGMSLEGFRSDIRTQQAVIYNILVIGEAATKLAAECPALTAQHPEVPWKQIRGMRNRMAHGYFEIDLAIVWGTVRQSFPPLLAQLRALNP